MEARMILEEVYLKTRKKRLQQKVFVLELEM
jgi:hypothetical protein